MYLIDHVEPFCSLSVDAERESESEREREANMELEKWTYNCGCCRIECNNTPQGSKNLKSNNRMVIIIAKQ